MNVSASLTVGLREAYIEPIDWAATKGESTTSVAAVDWCGGVVGERVPGTTEGDPGMDLCVRGGVVAVEWGYTRDNWLMVASLIDDDAVGGVAVDEKWMLSHECALVIEPGLVARYALLSTPPPPPPPAPPLVIPTVLLGEMVVT